MGETRHVWLCSESEDYEGTWTRAVCDSERSALVWLERRRKAVIREDRKFARSVDEDPDEYCSTPSEIAPNQHCKRSWWFYRGSTNWSVSPMKVEVFATIEEGPKE